MANKEKRVREMTVRRQRRTRGVGNESLEKGGWSKKKRTGWRVGRVMEGRVEGRRRNGSFV